MISWMITKMSREFFIMLKQFRKTIFKLSKRRKFVIISSVFSLGILLVQAVPDNLIRFGIIIFLALASALLTLWTLRDDLQGVAHWLVPILPSYFVSSINLFYFLLPSNLIIKMTIILLFAIGMYSLMLTENIFAVASFRTIQLLRAAQASGFVFTLFVSFLLFDTVFSFKLDPWINSLLVFVISFPLVLQAVWNSRLEEKLEQKTFLFSLLLSWILAQASLLISLWPVTIVIASLFLVTVLYVGLGIIQQAMMDRLFKKTIREYLQVGIVVFIIVFLAASWGGK